LNPEQGFRQQVGGYGTLSINCPFTVGSPSRTCDSASPSAEQSAIQSRHLERPPSRVFSLGRPQNHRRRIPLVQEPPGSFRSRLKCSSTIGTTRGQNPWNFIRGEIRGVIRMRPEAHGQRGERYFVLPAPSTCTLIFPPDCAQTNVSL